MRPPAHWIAGLAALALLLGLGWYLAPLEPGVVALQLAFTPRAFASVIHAWSPEQLLRYRIHLGVDFLLLACYGAFGTLLATRSALFAAFGPALRRAAAWALPLAAIFDAIENALHLWLTAAPRFGVAPLYFVSASFSALKWLLLAGFAALVVLAAYRARR